jgi:hypothetical protein
MGSLPGKPQQTASLAVPAAAAEVASAAATSKSVAAPAAAAADTSSAAVAAAATAAAAAADAEEQEEKQQGMVAGAAFQEQFSSDDAFQEQFSSDEQDDIARALNMLGASGKYTAIKGGGDSESDVMEEQMRALAEVIGVDLSREEMQQIIADQNK